MGNGMKISAPMRVCTTVLAALALAATGVASPTELPADAKPVAAPTAARSAAGPGSAPDVKPITVDGTGGGTLQFVRFEGDTVSFRVHASAPATTPWTAQGSFDVTHVRPDGTVLADFSVTVDCLMSGADVAVVSGTITRGGAPGLPGDELGRHVGITIVDHGHRDHLGWSWYVMGFEKDTLPCTSIAPSFPTTTGNFRVDAP